MVVFTIEELTNLTKKQLNKLAEYLHIETEKKTKEELIYLVYVELNKQYGEPEPPGVQESVQVKRIREMMEGA